VLADGHDLLGVADVDWRVVDSRNVALDIDEVELGVDADDRKVLDGDLGATHTTSHLFTRENPTRIL